MQNSWSPKRNAPCCQRLHCQRDRDLGLVVQVVYAGAHQVPWKRANHTSPTASPTLACLARKLQHALPRPSLWARTGSNVHETLLPSCCGRGTDNRVVCTAAWTSPTRSPTKTHQLHQLHQLHTVHTTHIPHTTHTTLSRHSMQHNTPNTQRAQHSTHNTHSTQNAHNTHNNNTHITHTTRNSTQQTQHAAHNTHSTRTTQSCFRRLA